MKMSAHLSFDIQMEIIKRLPVKSLIQFRSVCKAWKSLIDSSQFIAGYRTQSQHLVISYEVRYGKEYEVKYVCFVDDDSFPQQNFALTVPSLDEVKYGYISSSHGLLCLIGDPDDSLKTQKAVLWNPAIRKLIDVALPNLVQQPFASVVGFGVCPDTKDPKLVKIVYIDDYEKMESISCIPCQVMVFTLSSREWKCLSSNKQLPRKSIEFTWSEAVIGKFIYWHAYDRINVNGRSRNLIMSFDMTTEEFREVDLPDYLAERLDSDLCILRLRESLAVVEYVSGYPPEQPCIVVWVMEDGDSNAFTKLFTINSPNLSVSSIMEFRKSGEPIVSMQGDNEELFTPFAVVVLEPCSEHTKDLGICGNTCLFFASSYTESLLLLDHDEGHIVGVEP